MFSPLILNIRALSFRSSFFFYMHVTAIIGLQLQCARIVSNNFVTKFRYYLKFEKHIESTLTT